MADPTNKPTPEEQLLRLIEGEEKPAEEKPTTPLPKPRGKMPKLPESLRRLPQKISERIGKFNLKMVNRLMGLCALILSVYLILTIFPGSSAGGIRTYENRLDQFLGNLEIKKPRKITMSTPPDSVDLILVWDAQNIFTSRMPKIETTQPETTQPETTQPETTQPETIPVGVVQLQALVKELNLKLVGVVGPFEPAQPGGPPVMKVIIERGAEATYFVGINEPFLQGTRNLAAYGEVKYNLKLKEIKTDSVIIYNDDETTKAEITLSPYRGQ